MLTKTPYAQGKSGWGNMADGRRREDEGGGWSKGHTRQAAHVTLPVSQSLSTIDKRSSGHDTKLSP